MKKLIVALFVTACSSLSLAAAPLEYSCKGFGGLNIKVAYSEMTRAGKASFTYTARHHDSVVKAEEMKSENMNIESSVIGKVVSLRVANLSVPDKVNFLVSLVIPAINMPANADDVHFHTRVIETHSKTSFTGENGVSGVIQSSRYFPVMCKAVIAK